MILSLLSWLVSSQALRLPAAVPLVHLSYRQPFSVLVGSLLPFCGKKTLPRAREEMMNLTLANRLSKKRCKLSRMIQKSCWLVAFRVFLRPQCTFSCCSGRLRSVVPWPKHLVKVLELLMVPSFLASWHAVFWDQPYLGNWQRCLCPQRASLLLC